MKVYLPVENLLADVIQLMAHGAIVRYYSDGIEFNEMLGEEDYIVVGDEE